MSHVSAVSSNALFRLFADQDGAAHSEEAPGVCADPGQHDPRALDDGRDQRGPHSFNG